LEQRKSASYLSSHPKLGNAAADCRYQLGKLKYCEQRGNNARPNELRVGQRKKTARLKFTNLRSDQPEVFTFGGWLGQTAAAAARRNFGSDSLSAAATARPNIDCRWRSNVVYYSILDSIYHFYYCLLSTGILLFNRIFLLLAT
jgi:hypothetical protein